LENNNNNKIIRQETIITGEWYLIQHRPLQVTSTSSHQCWCCGWTSAVAAALDRPPWPSPIAVVTGNGLLREARERCCAHLPCAGAEDDRCDESGGDQKHWASNKTGIGAAESSATGGEKRDRIRGPLKLLDFHPGVQSSASPVAFQESLTTVHWNVISFRLSGYADVCVPTLPICRSSILCFSAVPVSAVTSHHRTRIHRSGTFDNSLLRLRYFG